FEFLVSSVKPWYAEPVPAESYGLETRNLKLLLSLHPHRIVILQRLWRICHQNFRAPEALLHNGVAAILARSFHFALQRLAIYGFRFLSLSIIVTFTCTVALVRSAVGITCRNEARKVLSGKASTDTSAG